MEELSGARDLGGAALAARAPSAPVGGAVRALWIGGQERPASDGGSFEVENPATGATDYVVARGGPADIELAVPPARGPGAGAVPGGRPREGGELPGGGGPRGAGRPEDG